MEKLLTIAIPTYNRKSQLIRLLKSIELENRIDKYSIVISDNCSDYSVEESINECFSGYFRDNIVIIRRPFNGGADYNISSLFTHAKTKLFWIIGDDDEVVPGAIDLIIDNYIKYSDIPFFKYTMPGSNRISDNIRMKNVDDLINCNRKGYLIGGIIFVSNNVYNVELLKSYFSDCLYYGYCSVSQIIPMMHCLVDSKNDVLLCKDQIVKANPAEGDHWNYVKVVTSLSTILDINWGNNHEEIKKIFDVICGYFGIGEFLLGIMKVQDKSYRNYLYKKGMLTVFDNKKSILDLIALYCYRIETLTHIRFLTGFYSSLYHRQNIIKKQLKDKAKNSANTAKLVKIAKKYMPKLK